MSSFNGVMGFQEFPGQANGTVLGTNSWSGSMRPGSSGSSSNGFAFNHGGNTQLEPWQLVPSTEAAPSNNWRYSRHDPPIRQVAAASNWRNHPGRNKNYHQVNNHGQGQVKQVETDPVVLARRQKQIDYGKNTREYANYVRCVPPEDRQPFHPKTPPMYRKYSRRAWDGLIKQWRLNLHSWSDSSELGAEGGEIGSLNASFCSEATTGSTSTTSSMAQALSVFQDLESNGLRMATIGEKLDWTLPSKPTEVHIDANSNVDFGNAAKSGDHFMFSPPATRPASSLCFSEYQHFSSGMDFLIESRRQASSQTDLTSSWPPKIGKPERPDPLFHENFLGFGGFGASMQQQQSTCSFNRYSQFEDGIFNDFKALRF